jgi:hypothetical protein
MQSLQNRLGLRPAILDPCRGRRENVADCRLKISLQGRGKAFASCPAIRVRRPF